MERWEAVVRRALADAEAGDPRAQEWIASYLLGKPSANALRRLAVEEGNIDASLWDLIA